MKKIFHTLKSLTVNLTWKMIKALFSKPHLLLPTIWATIQSILFAETYFRESHGGRGVENAFRHAVWNVLIAQNASFFTSKEKAVEWAKFITDMHEECFPNEPFDHYMDLHNNQFGRDIFVELTYQESASTKDMVKYLFMKSKSAVGLVDESEFGNHTDKMVFFADF